MLWETLNFVAVHHQIKLLLDECVCYYHYLIGITFALRSINPSQSSHIYLNVIIWRTPTFNWMILTQTFMSAGTPPPADYESLNPYQLQGSNLSLTSTEMWIGLQVTKQSALLLFVVALVVVVVKVPLKPYSTFFAVPWIPLLKLEM